jgi:hypothetical protein
MRRILAALLLPLIAPAPAPSRRAVPFGPKRVIPLPAARTPMSIAAADVNGDGKLDVLVGNGGTQDVTVFLGDGKGGLSESRSFAAGPEPTEIAIADLDRDGHLDLAIANHGTPRVTVLLGDGKGGFRPAPGSPLAVRSNPHPHTIAACDANGDGALDLVIDSWGENRLTLLAGDGHGGFATPGRPIDVGRKPYRNLRLGDLDGDGKCDVVVPNMVEHAVTVLLGDGRGGFFGAEKPPIAAGPSPFAVAVGDLDGDGKPDLAVVNYSGQMSDPSGDALTFLLGDGKGGFRLGPRIDACRSSGEVAIGDVDGDGIADAVTVNAGTRDVTVAYGGKGGLSPERLARVPIGAASWRLVVADLNGDRRADVVTANADEHSLTVLLTR